MNECKSKVVALRVIGSLKMWGCERIPKKILGRIVWDSTQESGEGEGCQNKRFASDITGKEHSGGNPKFWHRKKRTFGDITNDLWEGVRKFRSLACHMPHSPSKVDMGYQPMSCFRKCENFTLVSPFVKRSPNWFSESILTSSMFRGPICSRNQWYFKA